MRRLHVLPLLLLASASLAGCIAVTPAATPEPAQTVVIERPASGAATTTYVPAGSSVVVQPASRY